MASLWQRLTGAIGKALGWPSPPDLGDYDSPPPPLPPPGGGGFDEPPPLPPPPQEPGDYPLDYVTIYDDFGNYIGSHTWEEWWKETLMDSMNFHLKYGEEFFTVTLIGLLEEAYDIDWDWETWREAYAAAQTSS